MSLETRASHSDVVIAGAGISGLALARAFSHEDIACTVIAPLPNDELQMKSRTSFPIVKKRILDRLDIPLDSQKYVIKRNAEVKQDLSPLGLLVLASAQWMFNYRLAENPLYFLDIALAENELYSKLLDDPNICLKNDKLTSLDVEEGRISGVITHRGDRISEPKMVVDATGRKARVTTALNQHIPGAVSERKIPRESMLLGGYVSFDEKLRLLHPSLYESSSTIFLPGGLVFVMAPAASISGSSATHALIVEGRRQTLRDVIGHIKNKGSAESQEETMIQVLKFLGQNNGLSEMVSHITSIDRLVNFTHTHDTWRTVNAADSGLVLVGDSHGYINPLVGRGLRNIASDISTLMKMVSSSATLEGAAKKYNVQTAKKSRVRSLMEQLRYIGSDILTYSFGTGGLVE